MNLKEKITRLASPYDIARYTLPVASVVIAAGYNHSFQGNHAASAALLTAGYISALAADIHLLEEQRKEGSYLANRYPLFIQNLGGLLGHSSAVISNLEKIGFPELITSLTVTFVHGSALIYDAYKKRAEFNKALPNPEDAGDDELKIVPQENFPENVIPIEQCYTLRGQRYPLKRKEELHLQIQKRSNEEQIYPGFVKTLKDNGLIVSTLDPEPYSTISNGVPEVTYRISITHSSKRQNPEELDSRLIAAKQKFIDRDLPAFDYFVDKEHVLIKTQSTEIIKEFSSFIQQAHAR